MLCLTCQRVRPALSRTDYTADRARLIVLRGLCTCGGLAAPAPVTAPARTWRPGGVRKHVVPRNDTPRP
ncbi:hypothetical protein E1298_32010 [Actinomadura rubrisoli]|uniref:Uncharacterized protein n=1 Tax=Actinomadura rubrisoli TaxID=2530368 RepID=A0A4R5ARZ7_9ACTN|nr:hypothetical protein E1298_32010 [Actinomadura rubrisoli]